MYTGNETNWVEIPAEGIVHAFTVCHFGSEEFSARDALCAGPGRVSRREYALLARLIGVDPLEASTDWIG